MANKGPLDDQRPFGLIVGSDHRITALMNEAASTALQVMAKEKTKQDVEDTKQTVEHTRRATRELVKAALALPAFLVMYLNPHLGWEAVAVAALIAAPHSAVLDRVKDLLTERRKNKTKIELPKLKAPSSPTETDTDVLEQ